MAFYLSHDSYKYIQAGSGQPERQTLNDILLLISINNKLIDIKQYQFVRLKMSLIMHRQHGIGADTKDLAKAFKRLHMALTGHVMIRPYRLDRTEYGIKTVDSLKEKFRDLFLKKISDEAADESDEDEKEEMTICLFGTDGQSISQDETLKFPYYVIDAVVLKNDIPVRVTWPHKDSVVVHIDAESETFSTLIYRAREKFLIQDHKDVKVKVGNEYYMSDDNRQFCFPIWANCFPGLANRTEPIEPYEVTIEVIPQTPLSDDTIDKALDDWYGKDGESENTPEKWYAMKKYWDIEEWNVRKVEKRKSLGTIPQWHKIPAWYTKWLKEGRWFERYTGECIGTFRSRILREVYHINEEHTTMCFIGPAPDYTPITESDTCQYLIGIHREIQVIFLGNGSKVTVYDLRGQSHDIYVDTNKETYATLEYRIKVKLKLHDHVGVSIYLENGKKLSPQNRNMPLWEIYGCFIDWQELNGCTVHCHDKEALTNENIHQAVESYYSRQIGNAERWEVRKRHGHIRDWIVGSVTDMHDLFKNQKWMEDDISAWNVSSLKNASHMFHGARHFNADIKGWDTRSLQNASHMFHDANGFNADIKGWDTRSLEDASHMFHGANCFNADILGWDTKSLKNASHMFHAAVRFNADISSWDTRSLEDASHMFEDAMNFNQSLENWDRSSLRDMQHMFRWTDSLKNKPSWYDEI